MYLKLVLVYIGALQVYKIIHFFSIFLFHWHFPFSQVQTHNKKQQGWIFVRIYSYLVWPYYWWILRYRITLVHLELYLSIQSSSKRKRIRKRSTTNANLLCSFSSTIIYCMVQRKFFVTSMTSPFFFYFTSFSFNFYVDIYSTLNH